MQQQKKFERHFKRVFDKIVLITLIAILSIIFITVEVVQEPQLRNIMVLTSGIVGLAAMIVLILVKVLVYPDFEVLIEPGEDKMFLEFDIDDKRVISKGFKIDVKRKYILLYDEKGERVKIPYDAEMCKYLKEVRFYQGPPKKEDKEEDTDF